MQNATGSPAGAQCGAVTAPPPDALALRLDELVGSVQARDRAPSLSAAVFRDGEVLWQRAIGLADAERGEEATGEHAYRIGSITKTFTAVALLGQVEDGRLELDAPLAAYLDEAPRGPTLRMALAHLSGLQRETPGAHWETMTAPTRAEHLAGLAGALRIAPAGTLWHYSNLVFAVLGEIVARAGEGTYGEVLRTRVLEPLGLDRTGLEPRGPAATPYFVEPYSDGLRVEPSPEVTELTGAAGWLWSTSGDLARFGSFLADGDDCVLTVRWLDEMARVHAMVDESAWTLGWGLGLELFRRGDRVFVGHEGAMPGFLACLVVQRVERTGAVVLVNAGAQVDTAALALDLTEAVLDALPRPTERWLPDAGAPAEVSGLLGRWWTEGDEVIFTWRGGKLHAELVGGPPGRSDSVFEPSGDDRFTVSAGREHGEILEVFREQGTIRRLTLAGYPLTREPSTYG